MSELTNTYVMRKCKNNGLRDIRIVDFSFLRDENKYNIILFLNLSVMKLLEILVKIVHNDFVLATAAS